MDPRIWPSKSRTTSSNIQICEDAGCSPEDLPKTMNDREKWRERVRDIRASGTTWWWWWWWWYILEQDLQNILKRKMKLYTFEWQIYKIIKFSDDPTKLLVKLNNHKFISDVLKLPKNTLLETSIIPINLLTLQTKRLLKSTPNQTKIKKKMTFKI